MQVQRAIAWLKRWLTLFYSRYGFGKVKEISEHSVAGCTKEVYWFDSDSNMAGHRTPFNTVLMNKRPFEKLSQQAQDYVFLHEVGHASLSLPFTLLMYGVLVPTLVFALLAPIAALHQIVLTWLVTNSLYLTFLSLVAGLIVVGLFTALFSLASWLSEAHAELFALSRLGAKEYLEVSNEISEHADRGPLRRLLHRIRYPFPRIVVWLSRKI